MISNMTIRFGILIRSLRSLTNLRQCSVCNVRHVHNKYRIDVKRAAILTKMTRYEFEKNRHKDVSETELRRRLEKRRSDYQSLYELHKLHYSCVDKIQKSFDDQGIEAKVVDRFQYDNDLIDWADIIVTAGGDGTYLLAASKVKVKDKPIIGINTDPARSEGYLCLPKSKFSAENFDEVVKRLMDGKYRCKWRQRIRITLTGYHGNDEPIELHNLQLNYPEHRFAEHVKDYETERHPREQSLETPPPPRLLPVLALNEVFVGESLSSRVSYFEIGIDDLPKVKLKSSGITTCTGTGSTSWFFHINHLPVEAVGDILNIAKRLTKSDIDVNNEKLIENVASEFNSSLKFHPGEARMAYTIRDPIFNGVFNVSKQRGFASNIKIFSRMWDGTLVIDGGSSFQFNDGAIASMEILDEDTLKTIVFD